MSLVTFATVIFRICRIYICMLDFVEYFSGVEVIPKFKPSKQLEVFISVETIDDPEVQSTIRQPIHHQITSN